MSIALSRDVTLSIFKYVLISVDLRMDTIPGMADSARDRITRNLFHILYVYCVSHSQLCLWYTNLSLQTQVYKKKNLSPSMSYLYKGTHLILKQQLKSKTGV